MEVVDKTSGATRMCSLSPPLRYSFCSQTGQTTAELGRAGLSSASRRIVRTALVSVRPSLPGPQSVNVPFSLNFAGEHLGHSPSAQARPALMIITRAGRYSTGHRALGAVCIWAKHVFKSHFDVLRGVLVDTFRTF